MFNFLTPPVEQRLFTLIWPQVADLEIALPADHPAWQHPAALQATTAIANFALAITGLFQYHPLEKAKIIARKIEILLFRKIAADSSHYTVSKVLVLRSEQYMWRICMQGADPDCGSNLDTIIRVVHERRLLKYQEEYYKGIANPGAYGIVGFVAKRWLSEINGNPILDDNDLLESGFEQLAFASFYFFQVIIAMGPEIRR